MWGHFKERALRSCDEVCGRSRGDTGWWNEENEAATRKKEAHKAMCLNRTEENKRRHKSMKNKAKETVAKAMREKVEEALTEL